MTRWSLRMAGLLFSAGGFVFAAIATGENPPATMVSAVAPSTAAASEPADLPAVKLKDGVPSAGFLKMHQSFLDRKSQGPIDLLFLGDSITDFWRRPAPGGGREVWDQYYGKLSAANFGISGDKTQNVLWRIANGELDGLHPKVVVLLMGTNNYAYNVDEIDRGVQAIIAQIHQKLPDSKLLIMGIFPRGFDPASAIVDPKTKWRVSALRGEIMRVNSYLAGFDDGKQTRYLDIRQKFLDENGRIPTDVMADALHPTGKGYAIWAGAMQPLLDEMLK